MADLKKIAAVILALALCLSSSGCGRDPFAPGSVKEGPAYEVTGIAPDTAAVYADKNEIPYDLYLYWLFRSARYVERFLAQNGLEMDWEQEISSGMNALSYVKVDALNSVRYFAVIENLAKENGVSLSEADRELLAAQKEEYVRKLGSEAEYLRQIELLGLRPETYERINQTGRLYGGLYDAFLTEGSKLYVSDQEIASYAEAQGAVTADQILLLTMDMTTKERYPQDVIDEKIKLIEEIYDRLQKSDRPEELFQELADEYSEDIGRKSYPQGYTYMPGVMIPEFESAARQLKPGEISLITETVYGFHIIMRKELDVAAAAAGMRNTYFDALLAARVNSAEVELNPSLETLDVPAYYAAFSAAWNNSALSGTDTDMEQNQERK